MYNQVSLSELVIEDNHLKGTLFNYGIQESTIPELLISYYDQNKELIYVDHFFLGDGVRVERKNYFDYELKNLTTCKVILSSLKNCFVNGLRNESISNAIVPNRKYKHAPQQLQKVSGKGFSYIKIEINNFVGNPR